MAPWARRLFKGLLIVLILAVAVAAGGAAWLLTRGWADVRSDLVKREASDPRLAVQGRELLERVAEAHGASAVSRHRTFSVVAKDRWAQPGAGIWPEQIQRFRADRLLETFTSRVELLDGSARGEIWGIQSWATYRERGSGAPEFAHDAGIEFYLPTLQYFDELPSRLLRAPIILYAGTGTYRGRECERIFVTWGAPEPHAEHDQYDVWIDPDTYLVSAVRYTVRDAVGLVGMMMKPVMKAYAAGTMHFEDYRMVDGMRFPFRSTVTLSSPESAPPSLDEDFFHVIVVERAAFDEIDPVDLLVDPELPTPADDKPARQR